MAKNHTTDYYRYVRNKHIKRKKAIDKAVTSGSGYSWYVHDGQYSKGKIHCSCWLCRYKFNESQLTHGELKRYIRDLGQVEEINEQFHINVKFRGNKAGLI